MARVYLEASETFTLIGNATVIGGNGTETLRVGSNTSVVNIEQGVERIDFVGNASAYTYLVLGNHVKVMSGGVVVSDITVTNGQTLAFADGAAALNITGLNTANLGGASISTTAGSVTPTSFNTSIKSGTGNTLVSGGSGTGSGTATSQDVSAAGTFNAGSANVAYNFAVPTSSYEVTISAFAASDSLKFAAGTSLSISNSSGTDGLIDINATLGGRTVTVHLTGVATALDGSTFDIASFNSTFGTGALTV